MSENIRLRKMLRSSYIFLFLSFPALSLAATLSITPTTSSFKIGQTFTETIKVGSFDESINAVSASLSYPKNIVSLISVSKNNSIIKIWADEPSFSNNTGTLSFEGVILSPGFQGDSGTVLTLTFKVIAVGEDSLTFSSASVLANDGNGTNILTGTKSASLRGVDAPKETPVKEIKSVPTLSTTTESIEASTTPITEESPLFDVTSNPYTETFAVADQTFFSRVKSVLMNIFVTKPLLILLVTLLFLIIGYLWHKISTVRNTTNGKVDVIQKEIRHTFALLRGDLLEQLHLLEKAKTRRELTFEEKNLSLVIENHLVDAEKFIKKNIETLK